MPVSKEWIVSRASSHKEWSMTEIYPQISEDSFGSIKGFCLTPNIKIEFEDDGLTFVEWYTPDDSGGYELKKFDVF